MRIDERNAASGSAATRASDVGQTQTATGKGSASNANRFNSDSVEISGASLTIRNFNSARAARLEQLGKAVQEGSYSVTPALVSRALIGETLAAGRS